MPDPPDVKTHHEFAIFHLRDGRGYCIVGVFCGVKQYCGADGRWVGRSRDIGNPFPTLTGAEWYLSEWT